MQRQLMVNVEVIDAEVIDTVDPGGGWINYQHREDQQSTFTFVWKGDCLCWAGGIDTPWDILCVERVGH